MYRAIAVQITRDGLFAHQIRRYAETENKTKRCGAPVKSHYRQERCTRSMHSAPTCGGITLFIHRRPNTIPTTK